MATTDELTRTIAARGKAAVPTLGGVAAILLWSTTGPCYLMGTGLVGAMPFLAVTCIVGAVVIVGIELARGRSILRLIALPARVMMAGFFGVAVYSVLLIGALELAEPRAKAQIMLLNYLWPIWVMLLSTMLLRQGATFPATSIGAVLGLAGIILPLNFGQFVQSPSRIVPYAMAGAGSFCWAAYSVLLRRWKIPEQQTGVAFHLAACAVTAAAVSRWQLFPGWEVWFTTPVIRSVLFTGVGPVGFAYYAWEIAMKRGQVQFLAQLACMIPVVSAGLIAVLYRETWTPRLLPAACFVALGCWISRRATGPNGINSCDDSPSQC